MIIYDAVVAPDAKTASDLANQLRNKGQHKTILAIHPGKGLEGYRFHNVFVSYETLLIIAATLDGQGMQAFKRRIIDRLTDTGAIIELP